MSASSPPGIGGRGELGGFADAFWLARDELRRTWLSYPLTCMFVVFLGFFVVPSLSGVFDLAGFGVEGKRMEGFYNAFFADYLFVVICAFLGVRAISGDYTPFWRRSFSSRLIFLRSVPIPAGSLVGSRALGMLFALLVNVPAFFLPAFLLSDLGQLGASYLWFVGVWVGYCLLASGLWLLCELTVSGEAYTRIYFGVAAALMAELALLEWALDLRLVGRTAELAQSHGPLYAAVSVLAGTVAFAVLCRLTVRRLRRKDLSV